MIWKIRWLLFQGFLELWVRKIFSSRQSRTARYRQSVDEAAFETWMEWGPEFEGILNRHIAQAERDRRQRTARFWRDVLVSAKVIEADPDNRRKRDAMSFHRDTFFAAE
jgi:hypothetical protein